MTAALPPIVDLRQAVVAELDAKLTNLRSVQTHGGTFDVEELRRIATEAPCVRVAVVGLGDVKRTSSGQFTAPIHFGVVAVAKDSAREGEGVTGRDSAVLAICAAIEVIVAGNRFGISGVQPPTDLKAHNEFSGDIDKLGVALWQVTWTQEVRLGEDAEGTVAALSALWVNEDVPFGEGVEPPNDHPLAPPFALPVGGVP